MENNQTHLKSDFRQPNQTIIKQRPNTFTGQIDHIHQHMHNLNTNPQVNKIPAIYSLKLQLKNQSYLCKDLPQALTVINAYKRFCECLIKMLQ